MSEIKDALSDASHPLSNDNGNLVSNALAGLIAERDALQAELAAMRDQKPVAWIREPDADGMALDWYPGSAQKGGAASVFYLRESCWTDTVEPC